ncbi:hypothetical protein B0T20DRAFT_205810 [Sordaria brevicollis]|uniref:Uncharacterized protein n=1 Tax=Sordaria brevicollis TaxID=83679 RepID=A0AAE0PF34_SORBR|nr:hypothetical protein B0T20DRAFT_205810 [Sordaria brevicollis]
MAKSDTMAPSKPADDFRLVQLLSRLSVKPDTRPRTRPCSQLGFLQLSNGTVIRHILVPTAQLPNRPWEKKPDEAIPMLYKESNLPMPPRPAGLYYVGWKDDVIGFPTIPALLAMPRVFPAHQGQPECSSPIIETAKNSSFEVVSFCTKDARVDPASTMPPCTLDPQLANNGVVRTCADLCHSEPHKLCEHCSNQSRQLLLNGLPGWFTNKQIAKSRAFLCAPCSEQEAKQGPRPTGAGTTLNPGPVHFANSHEAYQPDAVAGTMMRFHNDTSFPVATPPVSSSLAQAIAQNQPRQVRTAGKLFKCSCTKLLTADLCLGHRLLRADQFLDHIRKYDDWIKFRFDQRENDPRPCPKCMERPGVDAYDFLRIEGAVNLDTIHWACLFCQETVSMPRSEFFGQGGGLGQEQGTFDLVTQMGGLIV